MPQIVPGTIQILSSSLPSDEAFQSTDFSVKVLGLSGTKDITEKNATYVLFRKLRAVTFMSVAPHSLLTRTHSQADFHINQILSIYLAKRTRFETTF